MFLLFRVMSYNFRWCPIKNGKKTMIWTERVHGMPPKNCTSELVRVVSALLSGFRCEVAHDLRISEEAFACGELWLQCRWRNADVRQRSEVCMGYLRVSSVAMAGGVRRTHRNSSWIKISPLKWNILLRAFCLSLALYWRPLTLDLFSTLFNVGVLCLWMCAISTTISHKICVPTLRC